MGAEGGLLEEPRHELVILHQVNILLLQRTLAASQAERLPAGRYITTTIITIIFLVRHDRDGRIAGGIGSYYLTKFARLRDGHEQTTVLSRTSLRFVK